MNSLKNNRGQGLIEYLVIVALVVVSSIGIMSVIGQNIRVQFANVSNALRGRPEERESAEKARAEQISRKHFGDFLSGAEK